MSPPTRTGATAPRRLFLVDDEVTMRRIVVDYFSSKGWAVTATDSCRSARGVFESGAYDAVVSDLALPDGDAFELLELFKTKDRRLPVLVLTGHGSIDLAVRAMLAGADQFLTKPIELATLEQMVVHLVDHAARRRPDPDRLRRSAGSVGDPFLGTSDVIRRLADQSRLIAGGDGPVLLTGETGTGKGVLAAWLHANSRRARGPFVDLNCAGLPRESLESECFGHERGAFTGAVSAKPGLFEVADKVTVFLDEIGDTDVEVQAKLLKVIEEQRFRRMGDVRYRTVDVRIITATHQDLRDRIDRGAFRADLYFRVSTLPLRIPPLRERREDVDALIDAFLPAIAAETGRPGLELAAEARRDLTHYPWPGNIRELRNVLVRGTLLAQGTAIERSDLLFDSAVPAALDAGMLTLEELERQHIERVLHEEHGHVERTALRLGISRSNLYEIIRRERLKRTES